MLDLNKYECKIKIVRKTIEELKKNGINAHPKRGYDIMLIDSDVFPDGVVSKYTNRYGSTRPIIDVRSLLNKVGNAGLKYDESIINKKEIQKITAKSIAKAVRKYIDKLFDGYEPKDDLEKDMNAYVAKKTVKYMDKAIDKLEKKMMEEIKSTDDMEAEEEQEDEYV